MRLFIAIQFEETFKQALLDVQRAFKNCGIKGNYTKPENLHLTLAFIGEYGNPQKILDALDDIEFTPLEISLNEISTVFVILSKSIPCILYYLYIILYAKMSKYQWQ